MRASTLAVLQMVLHYAEDPAGVVAEAARALRPGGRLIVIDLCPATRATTSPGNWHIAGRGSPTLDAGAAADRGRP